MGWPTSIHDSQLLMNSVYGEPDSWMTTSICTVSGGSLASDYYNNYNCCIDRSSHDYYNEKQKEVEVKDLRCPHCGAPVFDINKHNCEYCNSYIIF